MAGITFQSIFTNYYTRYRGDSDVPAITDPEWQIAIQLYNTALRRWNRVDGVRWQELYSNTNLAPSGAALTFVAGSYANNVGYATPTTMDSPGGTITLTGSGNASMQVPIIDPADIASQNPNGPFAYFLGGPHLGFVLYINMGGADSAYNGYKISYPYYSKPVYLATTETGTTVCPVPDAEFVIDTMVAERFLESRNFPAYQIFNQNATQALANLEVRNAAGQPDNAWTVDDKGAGWGVQNGNGSFFS